MTESIQVIDELLPPDIFTQLASNCLESDGYMMADYSAYQDEADGSKFNFGEGDPTPPDKVHEAIASMLLFQNSMSLKTDTVNHLHYYLKKEIEVLYNILNVKQMLVMRVSCTMAARENYVGAFHKDIRQHPYYHKIKTAILYLNSNNGGTQIKDGQFVQSKYNRAVVFPCHQEHAGVWCTDMKLRFVLNMNYIEN